MSPVFPEYERQLVALASKRRAGAAGSGRIARRRGWYAPLRRVSGPVAFCAAVAVVVVVVVVALTTLGHGTGRRSSLLPSTLEPSGAVLRQERNYIHKAVLTARHTAACRQPERQVRMFSNGSPSPALLSVLAVLRRPAVAADKLPRSVELNSVSGVYERYIRLARTSNGVSYYIVPAAHALGRSGPASSPRCLAAIVASVHAELPQIPRGLRASTIALVNETAANARETDANAAAGGICLVTVSADEQGGSCGASATEVLQHGMLSAYGTLSGVVPDSVATVTINYPASGGHAAQTVTTNVKGNVFASSIKPLGGNSATPTIIWRSLSDSILKTVVETPKNTGSGNSFCTGKNGSC
jgi:hypothetical protein